MTSPSSGPLGDTQTTSLIVVGACVTIALLVGLVVVGVVSGVRVAARSLAQLIVACAGYQAPSRGSRGWKGCVPKMLFV